MFGIGPTELIVFLVILLLAVGPEKLPTFMRTVGKGLRQIRSASREFKDAIGLDELMREGDPFRAPPVRPPRARPVAVESKPGESKRELPPRRSLCRSNTSRRRRRRPDRGPLPSRRSPAGPIRRFR
jgi:TatA/E family protein of Tat protein translocase